MKRFPFILIVLVFTLLSCGKPVIDVSSIEVDPTSLSLDLGETAMVRATVLPENATDPSVSWSSSDESVAEVQSGRVRAVGPGTARITATAGTRTASCQVTVSIPVSSVQLDVTSVTMSKGEELQLTATVEPANATFEELNWESSEPTVATVDRTGKVLARRGGKTIIKVTAGNLSASCEVFVPVAATGISLDASVSVNKGETKQLTLHVEPEDATERDAEWSSSDPATVSVNATGEVTGVKSGQATITARLKEFSATCVVTVVTAVTSIALDREETEMAVGTETTLVATVLPDDASDPTVQWTSSDITIASVDDHGKVIARVAGTAEIQAKAGDCSAVCVVTVIVPVEQIVLTPTEIKCKQGAVVSLQATVLPENATNKTITWSSSQTEVAEVDENGQVTAIGEGSATITARIGEISAICQVVVNNNMSGGHEGTGEEEWD